MASSDILKRAVKAPLNWLLQIPAVRSRLIFEFKQRYYCELEVSVPLSDGIYCPISSIEHWCSFSEVFFGGEYEDAWQEIPMPARWLDVGCHAGYFSLYVAWLRKRRGLPDVCTALLVDADSRSRAAVGKMIALNGLGGRFTFEHGAISRRKGELRFREREFMASAAEGLGGEDGRESIVPILAPERILGLLPPPYDLVKIDVEGSEFDFLEAYGGVLSATTHLIIEWHSWHSGGGGEQQIKDSVQRAGFAVRREIVPGRAIQRDGGAACCGVLFCSRRVSTS